MLTNSSRSDSPTNEGSIMQCMPMTNNVLFSQPKQTGISGKLISFRVALELGWNYKDVDLEMLVTPYLQDILYLTSY